MRKIHLSVYIVVLAMLSSLFAFSSYGGAELSSIDIKRIEKGLDKLKSESSGIRTDGYKELKAIGPETSPYVIEALKDREANTASKVLMCELLGELKAKDAVPVLISTLKNKTATIRSAAARALGAIADPAAVNPLLELLDDENGNAREAAVYSLMSFGGDIPVKVARLLQDKEDYVRVAAIRLLNEKLDPRTSGDILTALQKDESGNVRAIAARALGALKDKNALDALMEAVTEDTDNFVREESALSLGKIGDAKAIPALISTLKDEYKDTQLRAASSLKTITGQDFGRDREKWSNWYESQKK